MLSFVDSIAICYLRRCAGTFMAYTIQYKGKMMNTRGYSANTDDIHVYAPELKTFIKLTQKQDDYLYIKELIEYSK